MARRDIPNQRPLPLQWRLRGQLWRALAQPPESARPAVLPDISLLELQLSRFATPSRSLNLSAFRKTVLYSESDARKSDRHHSLSASVRTNDVAQHVGL